MGMSRDRVRFFVPDHNLNGATRDALIGALGLEPKKFHSLPRKGCEGSWGIEFVCRPSQFARFMIARDANGGRNSFKELHARLEPACQGDWKSQANAARADRIYERITQEVGPSRLEGDAIRRALWRLAEEGMLGQAEVDFVDASGNPHAGTKAWRDGDD